VVVVDRLDVVLKERHCSVVVAAAVVVVAVVVVVVVVVVVQLELLVAMETKVDRVSTNSNTSSKQTKTL
jgi:diacylglycerol kinase